MTDDKFKKFKEKIEDIDLNNGVINMQSKLLGYQDLVENLSSEDIKSATFGYTSGSSFDNTKFREYKLDREFSCNTTIMIQVLVKELNQDYSNFNRGKKNMKFEVVNIDNENESFVNIEIID